MRVRWRFSAWQSPWVGLGWTPFLKSLQEELVGMPIRAAADFAAVVGVDGLDGGAVLSRKGRQDVVVTGPVRRPTSTCGLSTSRSVEIRHLRVFGSKSDRQSPYVRAPCLTDSPPWHTKRDL